MTWLDKIGHVDRVQHRLPFPCAMLRCHFTVSLATTTMLRCWDDISPFHWLQQHCKREGDGSGARMFKVFQGLCLRLSELTGRVLSMRRRWKVLRDGNGTDEPHSLQLVFVFYRISYPYFSVENRFEQEITYNSNEFSTTASMPSWNSALSQRLTITCNKVRLSTDQLLLWQR